MRVKDDNSLGCGVEHKLLRIGRDDGCIVIFQEPVDSGRNPIHWKIENVTNPGVKGKVQFFLNGTLVLSFVMVVKGSSHVLARAANPEY